MSAPSDTADNDKNTTTMDSDLSCFEILNRLRARLYISREKLLEHVTLAQKDPKGLISWVEFDAPFHSHLVKIAFMLFNKPPLPMAKKAMFIFILEVLNFETVEAFFARKYGAEKPYCPDKQGTFCANIVPPATASTSTPAPAGHGCESCGRLFSSRKVYKRHTCVSREKKERKALSPSAPEEEHVATEPIQAQATKQSPSPSPSRSPTPPPLPPPPPHHSPPPLSAHHNPPLPPTPPPITPSFDQPWTLDPDMLYAYIVTQYCQPCNQKHNLGPFDAMEADPFGTEVVVACPSRGHRLYAKVKRHPVDVESTRHEPGY